MESPDIVWAKRWAELNTVNKWEVELDWPRADFRKGFFESCGGVRKGESFAKVAILQYSASTGNGGQDPFLLY